MKARLQKFFMGIFIALVSIFFGLPKVQAAEPVIRAQDRVKAVLCPDGKPIGKPQGHDSTAVTVNVGDFSDAYTYLTKLCPAKALQKEVKGDYIYYTYTLPEGGGSIVLHDKVSAAKREIAVMEIDVEELRGTLQRVVFVKK